MNLQGRRNDASESRPGFFVALVQECGFHDKPLLGYQFLRDCSGFLQI